MCSPQARRDGRIGAETGAARKWKRSPALACTHNLPSGNIASSSGRSLFTEPSAKTHARCSSGGNEPNFLLPPTYQRTQYFFVYRGKLPGFLDPLTSTPDILIAGLPSAQGGGGQKTHGVLRLEGQGLLRRGEGGG